MHRIQPSAESARRGLGQQQRWSGGGRCGRAWEPGGQEWCGQWSCMAGLEVPLAADSAESTRQDNQQTPGSE
jgi:hypothetical protein